MKRLLGVRFPLRRNPRLSSSGSMGQPMVNRADAYTVRCQLGDVRSASESISTWVHVTPPRPFIVPRKRRRLVRWNAGLCNERTEAVTKHMSADSLTQARTHSRLSDTALRDVLASEGAGALRGESELLVSTAPVSEFLLKMRRESLRDDRQKRDLSYPSAGLRGDGIRGFAGLEWRELPSNSKHPVHEVNITPSKCDRL